MAESADESFTRGTLLCGALANLARKEGKLQEQDEKVGANREERKSPQKLTKKPRKSVSFSVEPEIYRPVIQEGIEEHLCRVLGFAQEEQSRIKRSDLAPLHLFMERSARAVGHTRFFLDGPRFDHEDAKRWRMLGEDGSLTAEEINEALPRSLESFSFVPRHIDRLINVWKNPPSHVFVEDGTSVSCAVCYEVQTAWCERCEACPGCTAKGEKDSDLSAICDLAIADEL